VTEVSIGLKSGWLADQIELMKILQGYEIEGINDETGGIDYVASGDHGRRFLTVIIDPWLNLRRADMKIITKIVDSLEGEDYEEVVVMAKEFTEASLRLLRGKDIGYISPETRPRFSTFEIIDAIQRLTHELCEAKCGKAPTREGDCKGYQEGRYTCPVRLISDNADFHGERRWSWLLRRDFSKLVTLREKMDEK